MSREFNGILPADQRRFHPNQRVLTPLWVAGCNESGLSGWQAEVVVGTVVSVDDEYDMAPDAETLYWQVLIVQAIVAGQTKRLNRTNYNTIGLPA